VWPAATDADGRVLVEERVDIACEVAVLVARRPAGQATRTPAVETVQHDGMLRELVVPARVPPPVAAEAGELAQRIVEHVGAVGICAVELLWSGERLLINEIATRPHNSGHWTIDAAATSQFANHLRAVADWPLGEMHVTAPAVCSVNVVGGDDGGRPHHFLPDALAVDGARVHLYGKHPRPGRKLGHVTATGDDVGRARARAHRAAQVLSGAATGHGVTAPDPAVGSDPAAASGDDAAPGGPGHPDRSATTPAG
jgi:5-(carboxyamino)imidazole ribonucleotide synthase